MGFGRYALAHQPNDEEEHARTGHDTQQDERERRNLANRDADEEERTAPQNGQEKEKTPLDRRHGAA